MTRIKDFLGRSLRNVYRYGKMTKSSDATETDSVRPELVVVLDDDDWLVYMRSLMDEHFIKDRMMTVEFLPLTGLVGLGHHCVFNPEWVLLGSMDGTKMAAILVADIPSLETFTERWNSQILQGLRELMTACLCITNHEERFHRCCFRLHLFEYTSSPVLAFYEDREENSPVCESVWEIFPDAREKILPKFTPSGTLSDANSFGMAYNFSAEPDRGLGPDQKDLFRVVISAINLKLYKFLMANLSSYVLDQPKHKLLGIVKGIADSYYGRTDSTVPAKMSLKNISDRQYRN